MRKIILTGASGGIGSAIAERLLQQGDMLAVCGRDVEGLKAMYAAYGDRCHCFSCDLTSVADCQAFVDKAIGAMGGMDCLINCAGTLSMKDRTGDFLGYTEEEFDRVFDTNFKSIFFLCQKVLAYMTEQKVEGNILNIASEMGYRAGRTAYHLSKSALIQFTKGLGLAYAKYGIVVNGIAPGPVNTKMIDCDTESPNVHMEIPNRRYADPSEIAELTAFMISPAGRNMVGTMVLCDGGDLLK